MTQAKPASQEDLGRRHRGATLADEIAADMEVGSARGELLGERERVAGLDQDVEAPAFDLGLFAAHRVLEKCLCGLGHGLARGFVLPSTNPSGGCWRAREIFTSGP